MNEIERCRREQARCRDAILARDFGPTNDEFGTWLGLQDWFREELFMIEKRGGERVTRWSRVRRAYVRDPRIDAFLEDLVKVCEKHGMTISHEDSHGAFIVERMAAENLLWLRAAHSGIIE